MSAPFLRWSIKTKSVALFVGYVAALCTVFGAFTFSLLRREAAGAHDGLRQTASMLAAEVDAHIEAGRQRLTTVSRLPGLVYGLRTLDEAKGEGPIAPWTTLHYLFFKSPVFTGGVLLIDSSGKVLWTEPPGLPLLFHNVGGVPSVAETLRHRAYITEGLEADDVLDRPHVIITAAIETPEGERAGTLAGVVDLTAPGFTSLLTAVSTAEGRFAALVDQHGAALAHTGGGSLLQPLTPMARDAASSLLEPASLVNAPWRVVAGQPESTALAGIHRLERVLLWLGVGLTLAVLAVGVPFVRGFLGSIQALTRAAAVMAEGNLSEPVHVGERRDELASLARTFEHMRRELDRSHRALEQRLEEREELIRLKEEFLANVSHELRTPLNVILGYTDMLLEQDLGAEATPLLGSIRSHSEHLFGLLRDLMTLSGLNTGRIAIELADVAVPDLLARLTPLVEQLQRGKDVRVQWDCPHALPVVKTDALRLEQVLTNLVTNAFKFTEKGTIAIRARHDATRNAIVFEVADSGIGIPAEELPHIFDEFRQVDGSMSRTYGGIGLGLALVRKLTGMLQGEVAVTSRVDNGSTFSVAIPLHVA